MSSGGILICRTCKETGSLGYHPRGEKPLVKYEGQTWFLQDADLGDTFMADHKGHDVYSYSDAYGSLVGYVFDKGIEYDDDYGFAEIDWDTGKLI